jgi:hypothetical protein
VVIGNNHINSGCFCQCYPIETLMALPHRLWQLSHYD